MRLYFHLIDNHDSLPDLEGVEATDLAQAKTAAVDLLRELQQEDASVARDWSGWRLDIADATGAVLGSIDLDRAVQ